MPRSTPPRALAFRRAAAPGLGVWKRADAGVGRLKFKQKVEALTAPATYRAVVSFRWINANGRVFARAQHVTPICQQPDLRPNLRIGRITGSRTAHPSTPPPAATLPHQGLSAARGFDVSLSVGGVPVVPTKTVGLLRAGLRVTLQFTGQRCTGTEPIVAAADAGGAVAGSNETDNGLTVVCPIVGTSSAR